MKLWLRQTMICLLVIMLSFSACIYFFVAQQTAMQLDAAENSAQQSLLVFCEHLSTLEKTGTLQYDADQTTRRALIQYTFATYAHLLQSASRSWSLVMDGTYLYNISVCQPQELLPLDDTMIAGRRMVEVEGVPLLVLAQTMEVLDTSIIIYAVEDMSETFAAIDALARNAQLALLACLLLSAVVLPLTLRRTLRPLRTLTDASEHISGGQYALRTGIATADEVGELSRSFDHMAATIEQKISDLEDLAHRRELLLGALTHEMKTPMTAIIGFSDSLLSMPLTEEERMEASHEIHEAALRTERLSQKMMQLIAMTDCPVLVSKALSAHELLEQVGRMMADTLHDRGMTLDGQAEVDTLHGDSDLIVCLLTNLIDNAAKASRAGQVIRLTARADAHLYRLTVSDQGSGIPADKLPLVTEPFYRVDKARSRKMGGAGLGLALCRMIAEAHGGTLLIESREGAGTSITMQWPKEDVHEETHA